MLLDAAGQSLTVLELKSVKRQRDNVYGSHEAQLYGQLGLLHDYWEQPVFSVRRLEQSLSEPVDSDFCSFPELLKREFNLHFPNQVKSISIQGFVLTVSPDSARAFGPYEANAEISEVIMDTAVGIWEHLANIKPGLETLKDVPYQQGFAPLCDFCPINHGCPKFVGLDHPSIEPELAAVAKLKEERTRIDEEIKEREDQLKAIAALIAKPGQCINGETRRFKVSQQSGRSGFDSEMFKAQISRSHKIDEQELSKLLASAQKIGRPFERFQLSTIK